MCLLAGDVWLFVGGGLALVYGNTGAGLVYDATLHAISVGFVFSMIFGHAPVIFPSVLGVSILYRPVVYGHVILLHASLGLRLFGYLSAIEALRRWGNAAAILLFLGVTLVSAVTASAAEEASGHESLLDPASVPERAAGPEDEASIPDLELPDRDE